jgi:hypothetical protein
MASMTAIFPTFTHWLGKLKRLIEADEERYLRQVQAKGLQHLLGTIL